MKKLNFTFLIVLFCAFFVNAQNGNQVIEINSRVKYQWIGKYDLKKINSILTDDAKEFSKYDVTYNPGKNGVNLYRITYQSIIPEFNNRITWASGLIAIPDNAKGKMPVLSYQHGTVFGKTDVPSFPDESAEIRLTLANFAGNGYVVIAADNFGKGTSTEYDAYQIKSSTQQADIDMYFAAQDVLKSMNLQQSSLFLSGWSMGSWSTLMFIQKLQELNISVKAAYVACLPSDIYALVNSWLNVKNENNAVWLPAIIALQLNSFSHYYDLPGIVEASIKEKYQQASKDYYENKIDYAAFYKMTTGDIQEFVKPEFIQSGIIGNSRYWKAARESASHAFRSEIPIQVYYGEADEALPVYISSILEEYQKNVGGAKVQTISSGKNGDHRGTYKYSIKQAKLWFDSLK